jgi:hypothetical protein
MYESNAYPTFYSSRLWQLQELCRTRQLVPVGPYTIVGYRLEVANVGSYSDSFGLLECVESYLHMSGYVSLHVCSFLKIFLSEKFSAT